MSNLVEQAVRVQMRIISKDGMAITVEDLFVMPLTHTRQISLDGIYMKLKKELGDTSSDSFFGENKNSMLQLQFSVVEHIMKLRVTEEAAKTDSVSTSKHNANIDALIASKKAEQQQSLSIEELERLKK